MTIQHPLEYTIPLYFSLFGFRNSSYMMPFSVSLPVRGKLLEAQENADSELFEKTTRGYSNKMNGLVFLHALTLVHMTPVDKEAEDPEVFKEL